MYIPQFWCGVAITIIIEIVILIIYAIYINKRGGNNEHRKD